jgi:HD-GYP domain-containing protein (c-di-GMP phosphodiesterase class II)
MAERLGLGAGVRLGLRHSMERWDGKGDAYRAALLHDLRRVAVSGNVWERPGPLTATQWEQVRLHPYHTERILSRSTALEPLARLLAAADAYQAMTQDRPYRPALAPDAVARELEAATRAGRHDPECARAVLQAAGQRPSRSRSPWPAGLSDREVEVLRLVASGLSNRQIADTLVHLAPRRRAPRPAPLHQDRCLDPRRGRDVRHGARPAPLTPGRKPLATAAGG